MTLQTAIRDRPLWLLVAAGLLLAVGYVLSEFVGTIVFGLFIYYATRPVYRRLVDRIGSPTLAAGISIVALVLPALALAGYALLIVLRELNNLTDWAAIEPEALGIDPAVYDRLTDPAVLLSPEAREFLTAELVGSVVGSLTSAIGTLAWVAVVLINGFVMVALAFYLLRDDDRLGSWLDAELGERGTLLVEFLQAVDDDLEGIFFGNILNAVFTGTIGVITYSVLNVFAPEGVAIPAAALVGLLAGAASLLPIVGMKLVYVPVGGYLAVVSLTSAGADTLPFVGLFFFVSFVVVDVIPDLLLRPYVSGKNVHVGALMLAYTLGPLLFGWYGLFLLPVVLVLLVQFARIVLPELLDSPTATRRDRRGTLVGIRRETPIVERSPRPPDSDPDQ